jgi:uncharacterized metal-binding protein YceD (DUF177 family)
MIITVTDIPVEGKEVEFGLDVVSLNQRINTIADVAEKGVVPPPEYRFADPPKVELKIELQGSTVMIKGRASGTFFAACSRCAEDLETSLSTSIYVALKPRRGDMGSIEEAEDVNFGYYIGNEINCADLVEEQLIIQLPQTVTCSAKSIEECPLAGARIKACLQNEIEGGTDERMALFRSLKVN